MKNIAIITGASSGMGKDFAKEIDNKNLDQIWLIARRKELLEKLSNELKTDCKIFAMDLTNIRNNTIIETELKTNKYRINYLINNAGFGLMGEFIKLELNKQMDMINLNISALVQITYFSINHISKNGKIIQVASTAGFLPIKNFAVYAATKAFVVNFSNALSLELKNKQITVTAVCPGPVKTEFFDTATKGKMPKFIYNSKDVVKKALKDSQKGKLNSIYGFLMNIIMFFGHITPRKLKANIAAKGI